MPAPVPVGTSTPINLNQPVPLTATGQTNAGEPLFISLNSPDQNLNPTVAETVFVTVTNQTNNDVEVVQLTETGPNTGVFTGYLLTTSAPVITYNGTLSVKAGDTIKITNVDPNNNNYTSYTLVVVDPNGIVFDSSTGLPVSGATITIKTATGGAVTVYGDNGVSIVSSTVTSDALGQYRFPFVLPGSYEYQITPPPGYTFPSTVSITNIQKLPGAPFAIDVNGSYGGSTSGYSGIFVINPGPSRRIDIPLDPAPAALWLQKTAGKDSAGQGDFIPYLLTVTNNSKSVAAGGVSVTDTMPIGFRLRKGSVQINSVPAGDPAISADGRTLTFNVGTLQAGASATISYVVEVDRGNASWKCDQQRRCRRCYRRKIKYRPRHC